ncbi:MAG: sterol desaturase family protein [Myxococcales bacterium]|nr:MAG: sterol desaturase family protein [Myxococcales bacterium]
MDAITVGIIVFFLAFMAYDTLRPARDYPKVKGWVLKGIVAFVVYAALSTGLPFVWDAWLGEHRLIDATGLGTFGGAAVGFLAVQVFMYAWHRLMHDNDFLWRWFHQMHHSAERVDVAGTFYFSPLDMVGWTFLGSLALVWAVGVTPQAAVLVNLAATFMSVFTHANIRTPKWLGYFLARPEMHAIHHERGAHSGNYCDLPVIDMIFGTYKNPETFEGVGGFYDGASSRVVDMLLGRDVSVPAQPTQIPELRSLSSGRNHSVLRTEY